MSDQIVSLHGAAIVENGAYQGVIDALEEWLERARRGELAAIGIVGVRPDLHVLTRWHARSAIDETLIIGASARLAALMLDNGAGLVLTPPLPEDEA